MLLKNTVHDKCIMVVVENFFESQNTKLLIKFKFLIFVRVEFSSKNF